MLPRFHLAATAATTATAAVIALTLASCTSTGGNTAAVKPPETTTSAARTTSSTTTKPDGTTTEPAGPSPAETRAKAKVAAVNLVASDFPTAWQSKPASDTGVSALDKCASSAVESQLLAKGRSDNFSLSQGTGQIQISSTTGVFKDQTAAADLLNEFRDDTFVACASEVFTSNAAGYTVTGSLARNGSEPGLADEAVALSGDFVVTPDDGSTTSQMSTVVVAMRGADTVVIVSAATIDTPGDEALLRDLLDTVAYRLAA